MINLSFYKTKFFLILEFIFIFLLLPIILFFYVSIPVLPTLWIITLWCLFILKNDSSFLKEKYLSFKGLKRVFPRIFIQFLVITITLLAFIIFFMPDKLFLLLQENPLFWLVIMIVYPTLSVYPQEVVYRVFFFYRYKNIFKNKSLFIYMNALLFGYMHILFHNWVAVIFTIAGGIIFAKLYEKTNSLMIVTISHSMYGCMIFTIGFGEYFYSGTMYTIEQVLKF